MSLELSTEHVEFLIDLLTDTRELLDNVHCYDSTEYKTLRYGIKILNGEDVDLDLIDVDEEE